MILAIDVGNTTIVIGCIEGDEVLFTERLTTKLKRTRTEFTIDIRSILKLHAVSEDSITGAIVSSVVPQVTEDIRDAVKRLTGVEMLTVGPGIRTGLNILIDNPAQLGSDLLADAVAASARYGTPVIVIDMGTATTLSLIEEGNRYMGGIILPGVVTSFDALVANTSLLQSVSIDAPQSVTGTNTMDCLKSGLVYGNAASLDGLIDRIEEERGKEITVVATGGLAGKVIPYCRHRIILDEDLMIYGLKLLYDKNTYRK